MDISENSPDLPAAEQSRVRAAGNQMTHLAFRHSAAVLVGPRPGTQGRVNNGSAFVVELDGTFCLGTAWHVVGSWLARTSECEELLFQVGGAALTPSGRILWKDESDDLVFLRLTDGEVRKIGVLPFQPVSGWPPPKPTVGSYILVAGYPGIWRNHLDWESMDFRSFSALLRVTTVGERHLVCQFERQHWIAGNGEEIPPPGADLGGMSGAPALLVQDLAYPLVGLVSEHSSAYELMRITTLSHAPAEFKGTSAV